MPANIPMGRPEQPGEVDEFAAWIAGTACSFTIGFVLDISGGRTAYCY